MKKIAIVGCGHISTKHIDAVREIENAAVTAFCDVDFKKAQSLANQYGGNAYRSIDEMIRCETFDLASVLTSSGLHAAHVVELANAGCDLLVEKPMALCKSDAKIMVSAARKAGIRLYEVKQNRYNPAILALRKAYNQGRFGKLVIGTVRVRWCRTQDYYDQAPWRGTRELDGGVLGNQAVHHLDMLLWFMGSVESISAKSITANVDIESEDTIACVLKFKSGALGIIEATTAIRPRNVEGSISIVGCKGFAEIGGVMMDKIVNWQFSGSTEIDVAEGSYSDDGRQVTGHHALYNELLGDPVVSSGLVSGDEAYGVVAVLEAAYESAATGREVFLNEQAKKGGANDD